MLYRFAVYDRNADPEALGSMTLADDGEAFRFANKIIHDVMREESAYHAGWLMTVRQDARAVFSIPFDAGQSTTAATVRSN